MTADDAHPGEASSAPLAWLRLEPEPDLSQS